MTSSQEREAALFALALEKSGGERAAFLQVVCGADGALRQRLEALLSAHDQPEELLPNDASNPTAVGTMKLDLGDAPDEAVGQTLGRYKLLEKVGEGGRGVVYVAEQTEPVRRRVALKVIKLGMDTRQVVARFEAERQALAMMDHPNIAKVLDAGTTDVGRPYFVMELVRGIKITEYCDKANLSTKDRIDLFIKVCQAIQHAHQKGIIHRDIKPSNILVTLHDGVPVPKVIDFGIAKATEGRLTDNTVYTQLHQFIGTPAYMSPEQAEMSGLDVDTRSDIYSLGVLLYELLAGSTPFDAKELMASGIDQMRKTIREKEPQRPSTRLATLGADQLTTTAKRRSADTVKLLHQLKGDLDWIVMKCLEKDRQRRYDTANGLAADLKRHLNNEVVVARPPSAAYRFQKAFRRNKLVFAAGGAVIAALMVGLGLAGAALQHALKERNIAVAARAGEEAQRRQAQQAQANEAGLRREAEVQELAARRRAYASDMNLANQSIAVNNFGRAQELLARHRPVAKSEIDLRGWEWRYLWQFCRSDDLFTLCRQTNSVFSLATSQDGRWLAVGEFEDGGVSVWDVRTRQEVARWSAGLGTVRAAFSPREPLLAFSGEFPPSSMKRRGEVQLWNVETRSNLATMQLDDSCLGLMFSTDGRSLAAFAGGPASSLTLWSIPEGKKLATVLLEGMTTMGQARYATTPDLRLAALAMSGGRIRVLDLTTGQERWRAKAAQEYTMALTFSPDGNILASSEGYQDGTVKLWDVASGKQLGSLEGHHGWVASLMFWPDGKKLASASADQTIRLWDVANAAKARSLAVLRGHNCEVWSLSLLPDNATLVSGGKDGSVRLWDTTKLRHDRAITTIPGTLLNWTFSPTGDSVITLGADGAITRWHGSLFDQADPLATLEPSSFLADPSLVLLSSDGRRAATVSTNRTINVWDLKNPGAPRHIPAQTDFVQPLALLSKRERIQVLQEDGSIHEWDVVTGRELQSWQGPLNARVGAVSPDEQAVVLFGFNGISQVRDLMAGTQTDPGFHLRQATGASFSPDGKLIAAVSLLGFGKVWSVETRHEVGTLHGFLQGVHSVAFSADGSRVVAGGDGNETIKLWEVGSYLELLTLPAEGSGYWRTAFSSDGNVLGSASGLGTLRLWRAPSWEEISAIEAKENAEGKQP